MEIKLLFEPRANSLSDCESDPEEQEVSDDDDHNHKHRRQEMSSQAMMEGDQQEKYFYRPSRKRGRPFDDGYLSTESNYQSQYIFEGGFPSRIEKRRPSITNFSRFPVNTNQRLLANQSFSGDLGFNRGIGSWSYNNPVDYAYQMVPAVPIVLPTDFASRGLHSVANVQTAPRAGGFGLNPGILKGPIDPIHTLGSLEGSLRSPDPSIKIGIPRLSCRDFEEHGFCLRGDMCPMEHGVNRIVVEDVQSLSHYNLPVSLPSAHLSSTSAKSGRHPHVYASSGALINNNMSGKDADDYSLSNALSGIVDGSGADLYDPDQPLWNNDCSHTSNGLLPSQTAAPFTEFDPSDQLARSSGAAIGLQIRSSPDWGRMNASKSRSLSGEKIHCRVPSSEYSENCGIYSNNQRAPHHGKRSIAGGLLDSSSRLHGDTGYSVRKPAQKALRTVYVNCIPLKDNKLEALLAHFKKFGEVTDIHIPQHSERAYVQYSKNEEAEKAIKSPDAVMGNRFIKLMWANRDAYTGAGGNDMGGMPNHVQEALAAPYANSRKENIKLHAHKIDAPCIPNSSRTITNETKPLTSYRPNALSETPVQKKENVELLKEELRKKQGMLEQKRNEFRQQLNKLQKNATRIKGEVPELQATKKLRVEVANDSAKSATSNYSNLHGSSVDMLAEGPVQKFTPGEFTALISPKLKISAAHPLARVVSPYSTNKYKLDNRPTSFRVNAPLPDEFANVNAIADHFVAFGVLSNVDLEQSEVPGGDNFCEMAKSISAHVSFTTHQAAERAFMNGKSWNGHTLQLTWLRPTKSTGSPKDKPLAFKMPLAAELPSLVKLASTNPPDSSGERGSSVSADKEASGAEIQFIEKSACDLSHDSSGGSQSSALGVASFSVLC